jgi:hypothetical protein
VQILAPSCPVYLSPADTYLLAWKTARSPVGAVTISIGLTYPGVREVQVVAVPITLI